MLDLQDLPARDARFVDERSKRRLGLRAWYSTGERCAPGTIGPGLNGRHKTLMDLTLARAKE